MIRFLQGSVHALKVGLKNENFAQNRVFFYSG